MLNTVMILTLIVKSHATIASIVQMSAYATEDSWVHTNLLVFPNNARGLKCYEAYNHFENFEGGHVDIEKN